MHSSFLYQTFGIREQEYHGCEYKDKSVIVKLQTRKDKLHCPQCGSRHIIGSGTVARRFRSVPIGSKPVWIKMKVQRIKCKVCHCVRQEDIHFVTGKRCYTNKFSRYVLELSRIGTIQDVARFLHISWDTVKEIQKQDLKRRYSDPDISGVRRIGIDEFAVAKGNIYKTIVVDMDTGRVIYVGPGRSSDSLKGFWAKVKKKGVKIEAIATDLSTAFISSVLTNAPDSTLVFDHFHVVKLMNEALDKLRRELYRQERDLNKRKVLKGTRWLLLRNGKDINDEKYKSRLENALKMNEPLAQAYYLKESLKEIWMQRTKQQAEEVLMGWVQQAKDSKIFVLKTFINTLMSHKWGILAWYDYRISTGKVEGINNKIKTMKRQAYGYRDQEFFILKILALHEKKYAFVG